MLPESMSWTIPVTISQIAGVGLLFVVVVLVSAYIIYLSIKGYAAHHLKSVSTAVRLQECKYRTVFNILSEGIIIVDPSSGRILEANETACIMYGRQIEDLVGSPIRSLVHEDANEPVEAFPGVFLTLHRDSEGRKLPVEVTLKIVQKPEGLALSMYSIRKFPCEKDMEEYAKKLTGAIVEIGRRGDSKNEHG